MIIGVDLNNAKKQWGERFGMTHFVNPKEVGSDLVAHLVNMTKRGADQIGGADYTFDCTGNVTVMRQALEACHRGWGQSIIIGVAPAGAEIATRPFQLVTGRVRRFYLRQSVRCFSSIEKTAPSFTSTFLTMQTRPMLSASFTSYRPGSMPVIRRRSSWSTVPSRSFLHWSGPQLSLPAGDIWRLVIVYNMRFQNRMPLRSWATTERPTSPNTIKANNARRSLASRT